MSDTITQKIGEIELDQIWSSTRNGSMLDLVSIVHLDEKRNIVQFKKFGIDQYTAISVEDFLSKFHRVFFSDKIARSEPTSKEHEEKHSKWIPYNARSGGNSSDPLKVEKLPRFTIGGTLGYMNVEFYKKYCKNMNHVLIFFNDDELGMIFLKDPSPGSLKIGNSKGPGRVFSTRGIFSTLKKLLPEGKKLNLRISSMKKEKMTLDGVPYDLWKVKIWK